MDWHTVGELKDLTLHRTIVVKLPLLRAVWVGHGSIFHFVIWIDFFLGPWLEVCQFVEISNQIESNGAVSNFEMKILCNSVLHNFFYPTFDTSPFDSIWLEISTNWHTSSQGPKKKCIKITKRRIDPCPALTARNKGSFTTMVLWNVHGILSSTVCPSANFTKIDFKRIWPSMEPKGTGSEPQVVQKWNVRGYTLYKRKKPVWIKW